VAEPDKEAGEVGDGLAALGGGPAIPAGDVEGVVQDGQVRLEGLGGGFGFLGVLLGGVVFPSPTQG